LHLAQQAHAEAMKLQNDLPEPCLEWRYAGLTASHISEYLRKLGRDEEALFWMERAIELQQDFLNRGSRDPLEQLDLNEVRAAEIRLRLKLGEVDRARAVWQQVLASLRDGCRKFPEFVDFRGQLRNFEELSEEHPELLSRPGVLPDQTAN
jgi:tetratricopeptide (TPR) repeat protein